jgi:AcrR family transcriptional regulator
MLDPAIRVGFRRRAITAAMAELCAQQGYLGTSVADVAARAGTSRSTVYKLYANREAIFLALIDRGLEEVLGLAEGACGRAGLDPKARIEAALAAILGRVAEHPTEAYAFLVEARCATPDALLRYHEAISDLAALLATAVPAGEAGSPRLEEIIVGGLAAVLARRAREGRLGNAPAMLEDFVGLATAPYLL